jgi:hypothetical protein
MMFVARRDQLTVQRAQELIANPPKLPASGEMIFRKPKLAGYMLILLFVFVAGMATYSVIHGRGLLDIERLRAGIIVLIALYPLAMGIRSLRYKVRVSNDELIISDLATKRAPLKDISEVKIDRGTRGGPFCRIGLMTGEEDLHVPSDLKDFPEFVSLLCETVNKSKAGRA